MFVSRVAQPEPPHTYHYSKSDAQQVEVWFFDNAFACKESQEYSNLLDSYHNHLKHHFKYQRISKAPTVTGLHHIAHDGNVKKLDCWVFKYHADVNGTNQGGETPLHTAIRCNQYKFAYRLVNQHGANVNVEDSFGLTPMQLITNAHNAKFIALFRQADSS